MTVGWEALRAGHDGSYRARERRINNGVAVNQQFAVLVHELAHALVDLDQHREEPALDYASEELVAESVTLIVCGSVGLAGGAARSGSRGVAAGTGAT